MELKKSLIEKKNETFPNFENFVEIQKKGTEVKLKREKNVKSFSDVPNDILCKIKSLTYLL